jgi:hypothetical protein
MGFYNEQYFVGDSLTLQSPQDLSESDEMEVLRF